MKQLSPVTLRVAKLSDLDDLQQLEQKVVEAERPFNPFIPAGKVQYYDLAHLLSSDEARVLVAVRLNNEAGREAETIVACGYVQLRQSKSSLVHSQHGYLGFMFTVPECRGQGVNQRIVQGLMDWANEQGIEYFYLDVYADNQAAIRAYEKAGFAPSLLEMQLHRPSSEECSS